MEHKIKHIAIIMDGNRTWATEKGLPKFLGHTEGVQALKRTLKAAVDRKIPHFTAWALSTENLERSEEELKHLFSLFEKIPSSLGDFSKNNVRFNTIGNLALVPTEVKNALDALKEKTADNTGLVFNLAVAYGGRDELIRAVQRIITSGIAPEDITEAVFENHLDTAGMPEIDLIIRTGGYQRLSGYLPWQSTYAELYFTPIKFPDFNAEELDRAIEWFNNQERKRGK